MNKVGRLLRHTAVALALLSTPALAQQHISPVRPIEGYVCANLKLSEHEATDFHFAVPIRTAPAPNAPVGTNAASVLLLKSPRHEVNGFLEVLQLNGQPGWIEASRVKPFDPLSRCQPAILSNGRIGFS
jgi:hypothetical protein